MEFLEKITSNPYKDLYWNVPDDQKFGSAAVIGGNGQNFRSVIKTAEYLTNSFPLKEVKTVLPDSLKSKLPPLDNFVFLKTTDMGSFCDVDEMKGVIDSSDFNLIVGDLSKNKVTGMALSSAFLSSEKPLLITRDTIDLVAREKLEQILMRDNLTIFGSIMQWQKIFRGIYYPKVLQPSQSLINVAESFHKFTLSFPVQVLTLHDNQILIAKNGVVKVVPIEKSGYPAITVWNGELASKIAAMNYYNPDKFIEATVAAIFKDN
ncbi:hypothetical protein IJ076_01210 [Candidatus Saccharibacteria bacterium]|nr:hypothetical protein [Candidatus Saccharibacteria bacterium]